MSRPHKKHHKIPRTYLEAFTNSAGHVWVADERLNIYAQKPGNILTENDYYTIRFKTGGGTLDVETRLLSGIEGSYAKVYKEKIALKKQISHQEKAILAIFVTSMMERQPVRRDSLADFFRRLEDHVTHMRNLPDRVKRQWAALPDTSSGDGIPADTLLDLGRDVGSLHTSLIPESIPELAPIIFDMKWAFAFRDKDSPLFITSDNPFKMVNPVTEAELGVGRIGSMPGLAQKDVEITFPLSSEMALVCGWQIEHDSLYIPLPKKNVEDINRRTQRHAGTLVSAKKKLLEEIIARIKSHKQSVSHS